MVAIALVMAGCAPPPPSIVPNSDRARKILDRAMAAWKEGKPPGMLEGKAPRAQVIDSFRKPGQALESYEIVGESASSRARTFSIRLRISGTDGRPIVRYLLVGIDPVLVFRQEDYDMLSHFEHKMDPEPWRDRDDRARPEK